MVRSKKKTIQKSIREKAREIQIAQTEKLCPENVCPSCNKECKTSGYIVVCRWHKLQKFHAKSECLKGIENFINQVLIKELDKDYEGYNKLKET